MDTLTIFNLV